MNDPPTTNVVPDQCSRQWDLAALPAPGSASMAQFWVALEVPGPWGHDAIATPHLPSGLGPRLEQAIRAANGRLLVIRRPGRHADDHRGLEAATCFIAGGLSSDPWLVEGELPDPAQLLAVDWLMSIGLGPDAVTETLPTLEETREAVLLVCTNAKRDQCCAVRGRPVAAAMSQLAPGRVWECSHTGGHRLAPTAVMLPSGQTYARLTEELAHAALVAERSGLIAEGLNTLSHNRGRSCLIPAAQAAEAAVRIDSGELRLTALTCEEEEPDRWRVEHLDGRVWRVHVEEGPGPDLKDSCLKQPKPSTYWNATVLADD